MAKSTSNPYTTTTFAFYAFLPFICLLSRLALVRRSAGVTLNGPSSSLVVGPLQLGSLGNRSSAAGNSRFNGMELDVLDGIWSSNSNDSDFGQFCWILCCSWAFWRHSPMAFVTAHKLLNWGSSNRDGGQLKILCANGGFGVFWMDKTDLSHNKLLLRNSLECWIIT